MIFYVGTHKAAWLALYPVPWFVSRRTLEIRKTLPRALTTWALDSGGFTELSMHGAWQLAPRAYVKLVRRFRDEVGNLAWAAPQDWMCEPAMLERTGLTVVEHQRLTIENFLTLRAIAPDLPFAPVLQGWRPEDYADHVMQYELAGVRLANEPIVGVGTVCRRQSMGVAADIFSAILDLLPLKLHGFGFKQKGIMRLRERLASADSMAWSFHARKRPPLPGCQHRNCANCPRYALEWRSEILRGLAA